MSEFILERGPSSVRLVQKISRTEVIITPTRKSVCDYSSKLSGQLPSRPIKSAPADESSLPGNIDPVDSVDLVIDLQARVEIVIPMSI